MLMVVGRMLSRNTATETQKQAGFTLVELSIATTVFSVVLLLVAGTIIRFTSAFQKSVTETTTQNAARNIIDVVSQTVQFGGADSYGTLPAPQEGYCIGGTKYTVTQGQQLTDTNTQFALRQELGTGNNCLVAGAVSQELLTKNMRVADFKITQQGSKLFFVSVRVAYGDDNMFAAGTANSANPVCLTGRGSQYCAVRELSTSVERRL